MKAKKTKKKMTEREKAKAILRPIIKKIMDEKKKKVTKK